MDPGLCIVMPVLNEADALPSSLASLQPFRARGVRIVVVDGGSADGSVALARPLADEVLVAPRGRAAQMNAGAARASAGIILFLHADTRLPADADTTVQRAIRAGHHWGRFDVRLDSDRALLRVVARMMNLRSRLTGVATGDQAIFVRSEAFGAAGGYPDIALMEDIALSRALKRIGRPACLRDKVRTSARRWERHGVWRTIALMWSLRAAYFVGMNPTRLARWYGVRPRAR